MRQALNTVYAHCVRDLDRKGRREFDDALYGFTALNRAGNDALRDVREADQAMNETAGDDR